MPGPQPAAVREKVRAPLRGLSPRAAPQQPVLGERVASPILPETPPGLGTWGGVTAPPHGPAPPREPLRPLQGPLESWRALHRSFPPFPSVLRAEPSPGTTPLPWDPVPWRRPASRRRRDPRRGPDEPAAPAPAPGGGWVAVSPVAGRVAVRPQPGGAPRTGPGGLERPGPSGQLGGRAGFCGLRNGVRRSVLGTSPTQVLRAGGAGPAEALPRRRLKCALICH